MKVLFIGGAGNISLDCTKLCIEKGYDIYLMNRGSRPIPEGAKSIICDINDKVKAKEAIKGHNFDVVVSFIVMKDEEIERDLELFRGKTAQYIFISSASAYEKPPADYLITEGSVLKNPYWQYSRDKIASEDRLIKAFREENFPATIVRPSFTYSDIWIPTAMGSIDYTFIARMKAGKKIISHGDGQSLWQLTHSTDFAKGLIGLFGNIRALGQSFHITSDEVMTWDQIYKTMGQAIGIEPKIVHIPSDFIAAFTPDWIGGNLLGDKACSAVFDNSKIKRFVPDFVCTTPFAEGIKSSIAYFEKTGQAKANPYFDKMYDTLISVYEEAFEKIKSMREE